MRPYDATELWRHVFGNDHPVELEIGPGGGTFILAAAADRPDTNFVGIERIHKRVRRVEQLAETRGLANTRILSADASCVIPVCVPNEAFEAIHIYFPDPWWKRKHFRRRYFTPAFVQELYRTLVPSGRLYIATDVDEVFSRMQEAIATEPGFQHEPDVPSPRKNPTLFEKKGLAQGATISDATFSRC